MYLQQHIQTAIKIISGYDGEIPFAAVLKQYFAANKKHGSKDRKMIAQFCYAYFRLGKSLPESFDKEGRMLTAIFLSENASKYAALFDEEHKAVIESSLSERIAFAENKHDEFHASSIFPFRELLSGEIEADAFSVSHLIQPDVFMRIRPGRKNIVEAGLKKTDTAYEITGDSVRISQTTKAEQSVQINRDAVIQDVSSQQVGELFASMKLHDKVLVWDCCAASGGKSILAVDKIKTNNPNVKIELTVSDVRESIIQNLKKRFTEAGIQNYESFVGDITKPLRMSSMKLFDIVICDAPCSGSGTWGRTPEQLVFFKKEKAEYYSSVQKAIALNAAKQLKQKGYFLYITCSVFEQENEEVVKYISERTDLTVVEQKYFKGFNNKADTLFATLFTL